MGKTNMALLCCCLYKITPKFGMSHQRVPILSAATSSRDSAASILSTTVGNSNATTSKNGAKLAEPPQVVLGLLFNIFMSAPEEGKESTPCKSADGPKPGAAADAAEHRAATRGSWAGREEPGEVQRGQL